MDSSLFNKIDDWRIQPGPQQHVVISSRVRYARNIDKLKFPPRASEEELQRVCDMIANIRDNRGEFADFNTFDLIELTPLQRAFLKESQIISKELESGKKFRQVYLNIKTNTMIMLNEEDHLRIYSLQSGFQLYPLLGRMNNLDDHFNENLPFAFHEQFGFLSACPTNTGTGIRGSVMLHLPALVLSEKVNEALSEIPRQGMTVRGFYGENSEYTGDCYQVSNEATLGLSENEIIQKLTGIIESIVQKEELARKTLHENKANFIEDLIGRAYGSLSFSRQINTEESMRGLSRIRLGIDLGLLKGITHSQLNLLMVRIQPAHLQIENNQEAKPEERDAMRAAVLRDVFRKIECLN